MGMPNAAPADVLLRSGWSRSVGGVNPYLTLFARAGIRQAEADRAVANLEIHELPSARGCTYVVPAADYPLALTIAKSLAEDGDLRTARKFLGVTDAEIDGLCARVVDVLGDEPMDPADLRKELADTVRNLGAEGKKRGQTTTLPLALGRLQAHGQIRRRPVNGRLDQQRYGYVRWPNGPLEGNKMSAEEAYVELARRYFRWTGPASVAHFRWFSALGVAATKAALAPLGLVPLEEGSDLLVFPDEQESVLSHVAPPDPQYSLISGLDALFLHRRELGPLLDVTDLTRPVFSDGAVKNVGALADLPHHAIVDRGRVVGLWEYEVETESIVWSSFIEPTAALRAAVKEMEGYVGELGDARSFSLDSPASRQKSIASLRGE